MASLTRRSRSEEEHLILLARAYTGSARLDEIRVATMFVGVLDSLSATDKPGWCYRLRLPSCSGSFREKEGQDDVLCTNARFNTCSATLLSSNVSQRRRSSNNPFQAALAWKLFMEESSYDL